MATLTTHVLNVANGSPAEGMRVELCARGAARPVSLCVMKTNADGRCPAPLLEGEDLKVGRYTLIFDIAEYFRAQGETLDEPPFLERVSIDFGIADAGRKYHVPLLVTPWSYSTYRGS